MNNLKIGPNGVSALRDATISDIGLDANNTSILYRINPIASWVPGRSINSLTSIVKDESYYLVSKTEQDKTQYFSSSLNRYMDYYSFESQGILSTNTAAQNKTAMQAAIDRMTLDTEKIKCLYGTGNYPILGPIDVMPDVVVKGNSTGIKGSPTTATFLIKDQSNSVFRMGSRSSLIGWNFDYPDNGSLTNSSNLLEYPTTVINQPGYIQSIQVKDICFIGGTNFLDFSEETACADLHFSNWYGYPLGGSMFNIQYCYDIPYIDLMHVNPGVGRSYRALASDSGLPFSKAMIDYVVTNGLPTFRIAITDEFVFQRLFAFGVKTGLQISNAYGSVLQANFDMVETGYDISNVESRKTVQLVGCSCYASAGPTAANRNVVKFDGIGTLILDNLTAQLGTNPVVPSSSNPNCNSVVKLTGSGGSNQRLIMTNVNGYSSDGTYTQDFQKVNASAQIRSFGTYINNATTKLITTTVFGS